MSTYQTIIAKVCVTRRDLHNHFGVYFVDHEENAHLLGYSLSDDGRLHYDQSIQNSTEINIDTTRPSLSSSKDNHLSKKAIPRATNIIDRFREQHQLIKQKRVQNDLLEQQQIRGHRLPRERIITGNTHVETKLYRVSLTVQTV